MRMKKWDVCPECGARRVAYCRFCNTLGDRFPLADLDLILPPEHAESVAARYNSKEDRFDDGEEDTPDAVQPFLADALSGSAFAGAGISLEGVIPRAAVMNAVVEDTLTANNNEGGEHRCRCHEEGAEGGERKTVKRQVASCHRSMVGLSQPLDEDPEIENGEEEYPLAVMCPCCDELLYPQFLKFCRKCGHEFPDGIDQETASQGTFYVPQEDEDDTDDEDENESDDSKRSGKPEPVGCCLMIAGLLVGMIEFLC